MSGSVALAVAWLIAVAVAARLAPRSRAAPAVEVLLAATLAAATAWVGHRWLAGWHLREWPVLARDFVQVCDAVGAIRDGGWAGRWPQRTPTAAAAAGWLARDLGIVDGLRAAGALALAGTAAGTYAWARAFRGPVAGAVAAALVGAIAPLAVFPRFLHVYPVFVASSVLAAAGGATAATRRTPVAFLAAGMGAGLALLVDGRGLPFALAGVTAALVGLPRRPAPALARVGALLLPLGLSFLAARAWIPARTPSLETQLAWFLADMTGAAPPRPEPGFLWGHSALLDLPRTLLRVAELGRRAREAAPAGPAPIVVAQVGPWLAPAGVAAATALASLRRRPRALLALAVTAAPFALALAQASATLPHVRLLGGGLAVVPLLLGVAVGGLAGSARGPLAAGVAGGLVLLAIGGAIPGPLHPGAPWRVPLDETPDVGPLLAVDPTPWPPGLVAQLNDDPRCAALLDADLRAGRPWGGRGLRWPRR